MPSSPARLLHPGAWWLWALGLATAAARTTNPALLLLIAAVAGFVVAERRVPGPWSRSYAAFLKLAIAVIVLRVLLELVIGATDIGAPMLRLPEVPLPDWMAGVRLGGLVTWDGFLQALFDGLRLAVMLVCIGAANSLVNPSRLLRIVPAALYEAGVAVVVCMSVAPVLVADLGRLRAARRLRGRATRGPRAWAEIALPLFAGSLERSVALAASMDSRGYGRAAGQSRRTRRLNATLLVTGLLGVCIGLYALLAGGNPGLGGADVWGWPMLIAGAALAAAGSIWAGRRVTRTRYRPDPWQWPEWVVSLSGLLPAAVFVALGSDADLIGPASPPGLPGVPVAAFAAVLVALAPAMVAPPLPTTRPVQHEVALT